MQMMMQAPVVRPDGLWQGEPEDVGRQMRFQEHERWYKQMQEEHPGITREMASLYASAEEVNAPWKWLSQFYMGEGVLGRSSSGTKVKIDPVHISRLVNPEPLGSSGRFILEPLTLEGELRAPSGNIGSSGRAGRATPFNPETREGIPLSKSYLNNNCAQCVASLVDAIVNESFVGPAYEYPVRTPNIGKTGRVLNFIREAAGPELSFGTPLRQGITGRPEGTVFYVVFTQYNGKTFDHVTVGMTRGMSTFWYDPQTGSRASPVGYYEAWPLIITRQP
jgi:hypothetical protein